MFEELEALVGHIYVGGGPAVSATPPGALVELPPRKAQRGREQDTFFTLVTPAGSNLGQATFYEQLARLAADLSLRTSGGVTSGLREAIGVVNNNLIEHNVVAGQRFEANMICLVLRGREVYVARAGACLCLLEQGGNFTTVPDDLRDEYTLNALPLGYSPVPDIKLLHYDVSPGDVMVLGDSGFAQTDRDQLGAALRGGNIQAVIEPLKTLGGSKAQAIVIEYVSVDSPNPTVQTPKRGARITRSSAAPAALPAAPVSATGSPQTKPTPVGGTTSEPERRKSERIQQPASQSESVQSQRPATVVLPTLNRDDSECEMESIPPVREIAAETTRNATRAGRKAVGGAASFLGTLAKVLNLLLDRLLPEPDEGGPKIPAMFAAGVAILVPVVIVFIVVAIRLSQVDLSDFEKTVQDVQTAANQAESIPLTDTEHAKAAWLGVLQRIDSAETSSGRTGDSTLNSIRDEAQGILDTYAIVTRRSATALRSFGETAQLKRVIVQGSTSLYVFEQGNSALYRDTLSQATNTVASKSTQPFVQLGQAVGGYTVKHVLDMVWMSEGGVPRANVIAALDSQGILITYSPTFAPATAQALLGSEQWVNPVAMTTWQGRLYVLDAGANQIWRYINGGTTYPNTPEEYFPSDFKSNLKDAVDFAIDTTGNIYILFSNGTLKRFNGGSEEQFGLNGLPDGKLKSAGSMYLDTNSQLPGIYITDPLDQSVYKVTLSGHFQYRFRSTDPGAFKQLGGVYADGDRVYVTSGSLVYTFTTTDAADSATAVP